MSILGFFSPEQENGYLSNWYLCEFMYGRYTYSSAEQLMMAQKALLFQDFEIFDKITYLMSNQEQIFNLAADLHEAVFWELSPHRGARIAQRHGAFIFYSAFIGRHKSRNY